MPRSLNHSLPLIPPRFSQKKDAILSVLAIQGESYTDLSPKGSVDAGIRDLIDQINGLDGIVTTSSCAGRISIFLEGSKTNTGRQDDGENETAVPGGKGMGGRWLFVSHETVDIPVREDPQDLPVSRLFALMHVPLDPYAVPGSESRFVKFQFEPMILHIMCASLHHAHPILTAAINAGFRESGVQSLKNLEDSNAFPMVAIRTAGLALGSMIGYANDTATGEEEVRSMVSEEYLETLLRVANARFTANAERMHRLSDNLFRARNTNASAWEDPQTRRERKKAEGLKHKEQLEDQHDSSSEADDSADLADRLLFPGFKVDGMT